MPTSELSDALNPFAVQRPRAVVAEPSTPPKSHQRSYAAIPRPQVDYGPHRSELELAIVEHQKLPSRLEITQSTPLETDWQNAAMQLFQMYQAHKEECDKRHEEQQARDVQHLARITQLLETNTQISTSNADLRKQLLDLRREVAYIRIDQRRASLSSVATPPHSSVSPPSSEAFYSPPAHLMSPKLPQPQTGNVTPRVPIQLGAFQDYSFPSYRAITDREPLQGSQSTFAGSEVYPPAMLRNSPPHDRQNPDLDFLPTAFRRSSHSNSIKSTSSHPMPSSAPALLSPSDPKQKQRSITSSSQNESDSNCSSEIDSASLPRKRTSHRDKRCLTVQHAMRAHLRHMLGLAPEDVTLPESYQDDGPIGPSDPVRFVWDKTTKQSVHNGRMKAQVIADIKQNRQLYKHVPSKDFGKKILDAAFEQCFTTFRQKYRAQVDESVAAQNKRREEIKARKARHSSRRKTKLSNRAEARLKIRAFEDVVFDSALRMECMSSEESDLDGDNNGVLRTRGYPWRSSRLLRLYHILDQEEISTKSSKPRRGVGKKERVLGPYKENSLLPPKDVAEWMIGRRWLKITKRAYPELPSVLEGLVSNEGHEFDWTEFHILGEETEVTDDDKMLDSPIKLHSDVMNYDHTSSSHFLTSSSSHEHTFKMH